VGEVDAGTTVQTFCDSVYKDWEKQLKNYKVIEKVDATVDGVPALKVTFEYDYPRGRLKGVEYIIVAGQRAYRISAGGLQSEFDTLYAKEMQAVVNTFKIKTKE
jgi:hypothetical protein